MALTPYKEWLRGRTPSPTLYRHWQQEMKIHSSPFPPVGSRESAPTGTRGTRTPPDPPTPPSGTRDSRMIPESGTSRTSTTPSRTSTTPSSTSTTPSRSGPPTRRFVPGSGSASTSPTPPSGGGGGGGRPDVTPSGRGGSFGRGSGPSGYGRTRPPVGIRAGHTPPSFGRYSLPSGYGENVETVWKGFGDGAEATSKSASTAAKGAETAAKGASGWSKAGKVVGKVLNSPGGKMARWAGKKIIVPLAGAKLAGDTWGAFEPGIDMLRYGHKAPYKDGVGGRDHRVNDLLGNISPLEAIKEGMTQEVLSNATGGVSDKVLKFMFPYRERPKPAAAPAAAGPATTKPQRPATPARPSAPAPQQPGSLREIGQQARGQSKAMRSPEDYLGSAFDATLRKGIDTGRNYLRSQMNKDGLDAEDQSRIMARFDDKIAGDKLLSAKGNEQGLVGAINRNDASRTDKTAGRGERTLEAYRQKSPMGTYGKGAKAEEIQRKFVKQ